MLEVRRLVPLPVLSLPVASQPACTKSCMPRHFLLAFPPGISGLSWLVLSVIPVSMTAEKLNIENLLFSQAFQAMVKLLHIHEKVSKTWHVAAIDGHSKFNKLLPLTRNDVNHPQAMNITTISNLYETNVLGDMQNSQNTTMHRQLIGNAKLIEKLDLLRQSLNRMHLPFQEQPKTKETAFQILNRTTWTNNKAQKSGPRGNPNCDYCGKIETIVHLIHN
jgi:hypothetical protein